MSTPRTHTSPVRTLSMACLITLVMLGAFLWCAYDSFKRFTAAAERNMRIQELRGEIIHFDEVLTMSARMYALTADARWEARYRECESKLDSALREAELYAIGVQMTGETEKANAALVAMENRAFEQAGRGNREEAKAMLFSEEYAKQKGIYSDGMEGLGRALAEATRAAEQSERRRVYFQLGAGAGVIGLLVVGWLIAVRIANHGVLVRTQLDKIERDLDVARDIQRGLLPTEAPNTPGFEVVGWSKPADQTGGDYFDWMDLPGGRTLITLADVSGHGIGPALIVAVCRAYMRATAGGSDVALEDALSRVNDLLELELPVGRFVTAAVGVLRPDANEVSLLSAGHGPLIFFRAATKSTESWTADDLPLGIMRGLNFGGARLVCFEPGDALVLATDGFFEWANFAGEQYGTRRLAAFVAAHANEPPAEFIGKLHAAVIAHADGCPQPDDLTVVVIKRSMVVAH